MLSVDSTLLLPWCCCHAYKKNTPLLLDSHDAVGKFALQSLKEGVVLSVRNCVRSDGGVVVILAREVIKPYQEESCGGAGAQKVVECQHTGRQPMIALDGYDGANTHGAFGDARTDRGVRVCVGGVPHDAKQVG